MTKQQEELCLAIDAQKQIVRSMPGDPCEELLLETLYAALRRTFRVVSREEVPQYVYSQSKAVLKPAK